MLGEVTAGVSPARVGVPAAAALRNAAVTDSTTGAAGPTPTTAAAW